MSAKKTAKPIWQLRSEETKSFLTGLGRKCASHRDRKNDYRRRDKHQGRREW